MQAACRYTHLKVHGKVHKYYGTSPIVFGSDDVDTVCNKGAGHFAHRSQILGAIRNTRVSPVTTSGSSCLSLLLCRPAILLHKYKIYNQDDAERHNVFYVKNGSSFVFFSSCSCFPLFTHDYDL